MKIIYVLDSCAKVGGVERVFVDKMNYLAKSGIEVTLVTYEQGSHPMAFPLNEQVRHIDTDTRFFLLYKYPVWQRYLKRRKLRKLYQQRLQKIVDEIQPDIISTTSRFSGICNAVICLRTTAKLIVESHTSMRSTITPETPKGHPIERCLSFFRMKYLCRCIKHFDLLVALTERDAAAWKSVAKSVAVIPNPVTKFPLSARTLDDEQKRIIAVGRYCHQKGFDRLIDAFSLVADQCVGWCLDIYGDGKDKRKLQDLIKNRRMEQFITLHSETKDIYAEYMSSDFSVLSSRTESFGLVIVEAMSCGLPCISFDNDGPQDIITDGKDGFLVREGDVRGLADKICWMCHHPQERQAMGQAARATSLQYRKEAIMPRWIELFNSMC